MKGTKPNLVQATDAMDCKKSAQSIVKASPRAGLVSWMPFLCFAYWLMYQMAIATKMRAVNQAR
jgi:hypothetical protein